MSETPLPETRLIATTPLGHAFGLSSLFPAPGRLEVDVGCGKGRFLIARAKACPRTNFLGIDRLTKRIHKLDRRLVREGIGNVRLCHGEAAFVVEHLLPASSTSAFYIFFPDPWPKRRHHRRRLWSPAFVEALHRALLAGGGVHIATDHLDYLNIIRRILSEDGRFEEIPPLALADDERTDFELVFLGKNVPVGRCSFRKR